MVRKKKQFSQIRGGGGGGGGKNAVSPVEQNLFSIALSPMNISIDKYFIAGSINILI